MMRQGLFYIVLLLFPGYSFSQQNYQISTIDITNFWQAYDHLQKAQSHEDSVAIIQQEYIDLASPFFQEFIRIRKFTAEEYSKKIARYPKFWQSVRNRTEGIDERKHELEKVFVRFNEFIPGFEPPDVCFAIGCLRTGGTVSGRLVLIGAEITLADSTTDTSELRPQLQSVLGNLGDIVGMVAHEMVHVLQTGNTRHRLLNSSISEGVADFITMKFLGLNINSLVHEYGEMHECEIWTSFNKDLMEDPKDYSNWLYNGSRVVDLPADLGYFVGSKIAESYYNKTTNKEEAINALLTRKRYKKVYKLSGYNGNCF